MVHPSMPPLPPSKPYGWPFNYHAYVKHFDLDVHVRVFKAVIIGKQMIQKLLICSVLPSKTLFMISVIITLQQKVSLYAKVISLDFE